MYKMIAMDLDNTLLNLDNEIDEETLALLQEAQRQGVIPVLATGRFFPSAEKYARQLGENCLILCYNGAVIRKKNGEDFYRNGLTVEQMRRLIAFTKERNLYLQFYEDDKILVERVVEETRIDPDLQNGACIEAGDFAKWSLKSSPKAMIVEKPENVPARQQELADYMNGAVYLAQSQPYLIEIMPKEVNKADSLQRLTKTLGVSRDEVIACGDNSNDLEMIQWAGLGVCVANGIDRVKAAADYVTKAERSKGVAEVIRKFILNR